MLPQGETPLLQVPSSLAPPWHCCSVLGYMARDGGPGDTPSSLCTTEQGCRGSQGRDRQEELLPGWDPSRMGVTGDTGLVGLPGSPSPV